MTPAVRRSVAALGMIVLVTSASSCGWFGDDDESEETSVFDAKPGMCFEGPEEVEAQVSDLADVPCSEPHDQEAYALVTYEPAEGEDEDVFPGEEELARFADGACAQEFADYVGIDYLDSSLYFTYLLPSPRSWEDDDREVLCLVMTAGEPLTDSVKDSGL